MGGSSAPAAPDYTAVANAAKYSSDQAFKLSQQQLNWAKHVYKKDRKLTQKVVRRLMADMDWNRQNAKADRQRYEDVFQPVENDLVKDYKDYASPERVARDRGAAIAGVAQSYEAARQSAQRELESYGINPSATRFAALDIGMRANEAAAKAAAADTAQRNVENTARALRSDAINLGRGYPAQSMQQAGMGADMGNSAAQNRLALSGQYSQMRGTPVQYMGLGNQAIGLWGDTLHMGYQDQLAQYQADQQSSSGWGSVLGLIGGMGSKMMGLGFEDGGHVPEEASPSGGEQADDIPAALTGGEFVIDQDTVNWFGQKHFYNLQKKAGEERAKMQPPPQRSAIPAATQERLAFADGGAVPNRSDWGFGVTSQGNNYSPSNPGTAGAFGVITPNMGAAPAPQYNTQSASTGTQKMNKSALPQSFDMAAAEMQSAAYNGTTDQVGLGAGGPNAPVDLVGGPPASVAPNPDPYANPSYVPPGDEPPGGPVVPPEDQPDPEEPQLARWQKIFNDWFTPGGKYFDGRNGTQNYLKAVQSGEIPERAARKIYMYMKKMGYGNLNYGDVQGGSGGSFGPGGNYIGGGGYNQVFGQQSNPYIPYHGSPLPSFTNPMPQNGNGGTGGKGGKGGGSKNAQEGGKRRHRKRAIG